MQRKNQNFKQMKRILSIVLFFCAFTISSIEANVQNDVTNAFVAELRALINQYDPQSKPSTTIADVIEKYSLSRNHAGLADFLEHIIKVWEKYDENSVPDSFYHNLADAYLNMGQQVKAFDKITKTLTVREQRYGKHDPNYASTLDLLGVYHYEGGQYAMADTIFRQAIDIFEQNKDFDNFRYVATLSDFANNCDKLGDYDRALLALEKVAAAVREHFGENSRDYAIVLGNQAEIYQSLMNNSTAIQLADQAQQILQRNGMTNTSDYSSVLGKKALCYDNMGQYDKAEELYQQALRIDKQLGRNSEHYAVHHLNTGLCYGHMSKYKTAIEYLKEAMEVYKEKYGISHPNYITAKKNLQICLSKLNTHTNKKDSVDKKTNLKNEKLQLQANDMFNKAKQLEEQAKYSQAIEYYNKSKQAQMAMTDKDMPNYATTLHNIGYCYSKLGRYQEAISSLDSARLIRRDIQGERHPNIANTQIELGFCYLKLNQYRTAIEYYTQAKYTLEVNGDTIGDNYTATLSNMAQCYKETNDFNTAIQLVSKACDICMRHGKQNTEKYAIMMHNLGSYWMNVKNYKTALPVLQQALQTMRGLYSENSPQIVSTLNNMYVCYKMLGETQSAEQLRTKIYQLTGNYPR